MIEKEINFFNFVYDIFYGIAQTNPEILGFSLSRKIQYPVIELNLEQQMLIPIPKKQDKEYVFEGMVFEDTENGRRSMWSLFLATIYHLAAHACVSEYQIYDTWKKNKTEEICHKVIDFIEDTRVENHISHTNSEIWGNIKNLNSKLLSSQNTQNNKNSINGNQTDLNLFPMIDYEKKVEKIKREIIEKGGGEDHQTKLLLFADLLYKNKELLPRIILPYCEHHNNIPLIKTEKKGIDFEPHGEQFEENIAKLDELWASNEYTRASLLRRHKKHLKNLHFDSIIIPQGNFHNFAKIKSNSLPMLKRIHQQIQMITSMVDEPEIDERGNLDMQRAIQAVASGSQTQDLFVVDKINSVGEAWVILVDNSASMKLRFDQIKEFTICVSESLTELTGSSNSWALYSFDNNFQILKDFDEKYNREIQARIGNLVGSGLSLLPDAIELANRILIDDPRERKFLFVITDGHASGYERIQEAFSKIVKKTEGSAITLVGIGISKGLIRNFRNNAKGKDLKQLVTKFITAVRTASSSDT